MRQRDVRSVALGLALLALAAPAVAAPCGRPDVLDAFPPDGAAGVPTDATLSAHYDVTADWVDEGVDLDRGTDTVALTPTWDANEGLLSVVPPGGLVAGDDYVVHWPSLRGINTATKGRAKDVQFSVGAGPDQAAPSFAGVTGVDWDVDRERDDCTDNIEERYRFDIALAPASDDGGKDALELVVFQTAGPGIDGPQPVRVSHMPAEGTVRIVRSIDSATGHVCFAAIARDLTGKTSEGGSRETCVDTVAPPFFYGCSTAPAGRGGTSWLVLALGIAAAAWRRRRERA